MKKTTPRSILAALSLLVFLMPAAPAPAAMAYHGPAVIHIAPEGDAQVARLAEELAGFLTRIDTRPWAVAEGPAAGGGIWLAVADPDAPAPPSVSGQDRTSLGELDVEGYLIKSGPDAVAVVGNSVLAVQHGMFDLLERMGCRFLTPAEAWTVIPEGVGVRIADGPALVEPDFVLRRIWFANGLGVGHSPDGSLRRINAAYEQFNRATRQNSAFRYRSGHSYYHTYLRHREAFDQHPEWARMNEKGEREVLNDKPGSASSRNWCRSNPELAELVLADRIALLTEAKAKNPHERMVSMDPNDGSAPCMCESCQALGNATDQALHLANHVARGIRETHPDAWVGILIYPPHNLPPEKVRLEPNVVPSIALAFNRSGLSYAELIDGWIAMGAKQLGVYEYFGVYEWDYGMPAQATVTLDYIREAIPHFHRQWKMPILNAQSQASWARYGPAMHLARKLLWDVDVDADAIYQEYFDVAFGGAAEPMRRLFDFWDTPAGGRLTDTNLARWLVMMRQALDAGRSESPAVQRRLEDMAAYLHTVVLFKQADDAMNLPKKTDPQIAQREEAIKQRVGRLLDFVWRTRDRQIMQFWGFMTRMGRFGPATHQRVWKQWVPGEVRNGSAHWMTGHDDFTRDEVLALFEQDLEAYGPMLDAIPTFSPDLVPLYPNRKPKPQQWLGAMSGPSVWHIYIEDQPSITIGIQDGQGGPNYFDEIKVTDPHGKVVFAQQPAFRGKPDRSLQQVTLELSPGHHRVEIKSGQRTYTPTFEPAVRAVWEQSEAQAPMLEYFTPGYFYVPPQTDEVLIDHNILLTIKAPSWDAPRVLDGGGHALPTGPDRSALWTVEHVSKTRPVLLNTPPYLANSPENMLVPHDMAETRR